MKHKHSILAVAILCGFVCLLLLAVDTCKGKQNQGIGHQGGMRVVLEASVVDVVKAMANLTTSPAFNSALAAASQKYQTDGGDFVSLLGDAWEQAAPGKRLAGEFSYELAYTRKDSRQLSNPEVLDIIRAGVERAILQSFNVLRSRIDRFGIANPTIERLGNSGRILVELPGVTAPERVRKLLQETASLEFWNTYENNEVYKSLLRANEFIRQIAPVGADTVLSPLAPQSQHDSLLMLQDFPLFSVLSPSIGEQNGQQVLMPGARIGIAHYRDTAKINAWLRVPQIQLFFPIDFVPLWSVKAINEAGTDFELIAVKNTRDGKALLDGSVIIDAHHSSGPHGVTVSIKMNHEGAGKWAHMTKNEMGYCIAIVLDNVVYSYPKVMGEITGGNSQITGNFTLDEAENLVNVIKSGKLPVAMRIVEESVVVSSEGW